MSEIINGSGLQNAVEAFCSLGYGKDKRLKEAWNLLEKYKDETGKYYSLRNINQIVFT